ncbi:MAG: ABC-2 type transporter, partial [Microgenomates group bacterium GW2011_GWC1_43_11]
AKKIITQFEKSAGGVLVATPMAIPLLDSVEHTVIISIDSLFAIPDIRMSERIFAIVYRHIVVWPKDLGAMVDAFWWPSFDMLLWGLMTVYIQRQQPTALPFITSFIIGGIIFWMFVYRSQQETGNGRFVSTGILG